MEDEIIIDLDKDFKIIAITAPDFIENEEMRVMKILQNGEAHFVHIRKPSASMDEVKAFLRKIDSEFYPLLKLHDHFELLKDFPLGGVHINSRNPVSPANSLSVSVSAHSIEELEQWKDKDYVFLSPIFNSISKPGYLSAFTIEELKLALKNHHNVIALGGVTPDKFPLLKQIGFSGAAMLGHFQQPLQ